MLSAIDLTSIGLTPAAWAAAIGAILFAAVLRGFTGFGFALAAVPLASLVLPPARTVAAILVMQLGIGLRDCIMEWRQSDRPGIAKLTLGALAGLPIGVAAPSRSPPASSPASSTASLPWRARPRLPISWPSSSACR